MATRVEGHPDNVHARRRRRRAGIVHTQGAAARCLRYDVSGRLRFLTIIPPYEVQHADARKVVPQQVALSTAVWQMGRIADLRAG